MAFEGLDISISGDSAGAKGAIASVKSSLSGLERSANSAQDSVEELGDEATETSARVGTLGATAGASLLSLLGLSSAATGATSSLAALGASTGTVTVALVGLAAVAAPLVATVGALAAAGASLAAVFGGGIAAGVATRMEELKSAFADAREEIMALIEPVGELFGPVLVDAVEALPTLVENVLDAVGPLEQFRDTLVEFGELAMDIIPNVAGTMGDLAREALPVLEDLVERVGDGAPGAFEGMMDAAEAVADDLVDVAEAAGDLIPPLTETGVILIEALAPAVTTVIDVLADLLDGFNQVARSERVQSMLETMRDVFSALATTVREDVAPVVRDFAEEAMPAVRDAADTAREDFVPLIDEIASLADEVEKTAAVLIPILRSRMGPAVDAFGRLAVDVFELISTVVSNAIGIAIDTLEVLVALLRGDFGAALKNARDLSRTYLAAVRETFVKTKDVIVSAIDFVVKYVVGRFQTLYDILVGNSIIPNLVSRIKGVFNQLREWFATAWDLHPLSDTFEAVVDAIGAALGRLNFDPLANALDGFADSVQSLIGSLNTLSGVNIDVDVPSFSELLDEAEEVVAPPEDDDSGGGAGGQDPTPGPPTDGGSPSFPGGSDPGPADPGGGGGGVGGGPTGGGDDDTNQGIVGGGSGVGPVAGLATGGFIERGGLAMLHSGERVVPESQVTDRGEVDINSEELVTEQRRTRDAIRQLAEEMDITVELRDRGRYSEVRR